MSPLVLTSIGDIIDEARKSAIKDAREQSTQAASSSKGDPAGAKSAEISVRSAQLSNLEARLRIMSTKTPQSLLHLPKSRKTATI